MLIISRKNEECIVINGNIIIKIVEIQQGKVRIGIVAPKEITVDRQEVHDKKKE